MERPLIQEQIDYYRARSSEYDDWFYRRGRYFKGEDHLAHWEKDVQELRAELKIAIPGGSVLELACGTGIWTEELSQYADSLHVVDSSPEVLEICRAKVRHSRFTAECQNLFEWEPSKIYDFVFFSFWLSHVPPSLFSLFWAKISRALSPGGKVFFIDSVEHPGTSTRVMHRPGKEWMVRRDLNDGREFDIVKIFYGTDSLAESLKDLGWNAHVKRTSQFFIYGMLTKYRTTNA